MRRKFRLVLGIALGLGVLTVGRHYWQPTPDPLQARFVRERHAEARRLVQGETNPIPPKVWAFFRAAERNDYASAATLFDKLVESEYAPRTNRPASARIWD